jgi:NTE family protein
MSLALVLGGGGVAGAAWETALFAWRSRRVSRNGGSIAAADGILGTSTGAIVGAELGSGVGLADLYTRQLEVSTNAPHRTSTSRRS